MISIQNKEACCGCTACMAICPLKCVSMIRDSEGFKYPKVDVTRCVNCHLCESVCPVLQADRNNEVCRLPRTYAVQSADLAQRLESSSGGAFSMIANRFIKGGGVVFGVRMTDDCKAAQHVMISNASGIVDLRGSKYLQSDLMDTYVQVQNLLLAGKNVLFSGTPCQIEGLQRYLRKEYENLFTIDMICHGVPSPLVWEKYVEYRERIAGAHARKISFRHKKYGWKIYSVQFKFLNCTEYIKNKDEDMYMQLFLKNVILRPSCYHCSFKKESRSSDLTMADYWAINRMYPDWNDDTGTSLVMLHSDKGRIILDSISNDGMVREVEYPDSVKGNTAFLESCKMPETREAFFRALDEQPIEKLAKKYAMESRHTRILKSMKRRIRMERARFRLKHLQKVNMGVNHHEGTEHKVEQ